MSEDNINIIKGTEHPEEFDHREQDELLLTPDELNVALKPYNIQRRWKKLQGADKSMLEAQLAKVKQRNREVIDWLEKYAIHGSQEPLANVLDDLRIHSPLYKQKRLDRPFNQVQGKPELRKKIARICNHTHTKDGYSVDWEDLKEYEKAVFLNDADQILALFPGIEEAKKQERERVLGILQREYPAIDTWQCWQALKEEKTCKAVKEGE